MYDALPAVSAIAFSPDGALLAIAGHHEIVVHWVADSSVAGWWLGDLPRLETLAFSRDGRFLAVSGGAPSEFGEIKVGDVAAGAMVHAIHTGTDTLYGVSWSDDAGSGVMSFYGLREVLLLSASSRSFSPTYRGNLRSPPMPLILIPLIVAAFLGLWALVLPLSLWLRYRSGKARRRALPWVVTLNLAALSLTLAFFMPSMAITSLWWPGAFSFAAGGLAAGVILGLGGLKAGRFEVDGKSLFYSHHPWVVLGLTLMVATRLGLVLVELWRHWQGRQALAAIPVVNHASLFAVAGVLLGYHLVFNCGLRRRLPHLDAPRPGTKKY